MSPKFVDKEQKVKEITLAALNLFSQKGFAATSVGEIAESAGIGKGTIYEYFQTKEDVFFAAMKEWIAQAEMDISEMIEGIKDPVKRLQAYVEKTLDFFDEKESYSNRLFIEILQQTLMEGGAFYHHRYLVKEMGDGIRSIIVNILLDGVSKGVFSPKIARNAEFIALNLKAYLDGIGLHLMISKKGIDSRAQVDLYMHFLVRSLLVESK